MKTTAVTPLRLSIANNDTALGSGNDVSLTILSSILIAVMSLVAIIFFWTLRKEIKEFFIKCWTTARECWTTTRADRSSDNQATVSLNDIIFDPEEEQQASLSESLLPSSS